MKYSRFSLADLLNVLAALAYGLVCFLGMNFLTMGDTNKSIGTAVVITVTMAGLAYVLKLLKKTRNHFKICFILEWAVLLAFIIAVVFTNSRFNHYFTVLSHKNYINTIVSQKIQETKGMFTQYEQYAALRENDYGRDLTSAVYQKKQEMNTNLYKQLGFDAQYDDVSQIGIKKSLLHHQLIVSKYDGAGGIKQVATSWLDKADAVLSNDWSFTFGVLRVVKDIEKNGQDWSSELVGISKYKMPGQLFPPVFTPFSSGQYMVNNMFQDQLQPTISSLLVALVLHFLMLLSYFVSRRDNRWPGITQLFGGGGRSINEI
jgi:hypothetical protein